MGGEKTEKQGLDTKEPQIPPKKEGGHKLPWHKKVILGTTATAFTLGGLAGLRELVEGENNQTTNEPTEPTVSEQIKAIPSEESPITTNTPEPSTKPNVEDESYNNTDIFQEIRDIIDSRAQNTTEAEILLSMLLKYEGTSHWLSQFEASYSFHQEQDGTPMLFAMVKNRFKNVNFESQESLQSTVQSHLEDEFFYLSDISNYRQIHDELRSDLSFENIKENLEYFDQNYDTLFSVDYSQINFGEKSPTVPIIDVDPSIPQSQIDAVNNQKDKIVGICGLLPNVGEVKFYISQQAGSVFNPQTGIVTVSIDQSLFGETLEHEYLGHYSDIAINPHLIGIFTPEEIVQASIIRERIISKYYQDFTDGNVITPDKQEVFQKVTNQQEITPEEAQIFAAITIEARMISELYQFDTENGIDEIQYAMTGADKTVFYDGWADFLQNNKETIAQIIQNHPNLEPVISDITYRPQYYDTYYWSSVFPHEQTFGPTANAKSFYSGLTSIARADFLRQVLTGNYPISNKLWQKLLYYDFHKITGVGEYTAGPEIFAESTAQTVKIKDLIDNYEETDEAAYQSIFQ